MVDPELSCFEPEGCGHLIKGLEFHKYYFEQAKKQGQSHYHGNQSIIHPHIQVCGDNTAVICYVRLIQNGRITTRKEDTLVWSKDPIFGQWKCVHWHMSDPKVGPEERLKALRRKFG